MGWENNAAIVFILYITCSERRGRENNDAIVSYSKLYLCAMEMFQMTSMRPFTLIIYHTIQRVLVWEPYITSALTIPMIWLLSSIALGFLKTI